MNNDSNQDPMDKLPKRQERPDESGSGGFNLLDISKDSGKKAEQAKPKDTGKDAKKDVQDTKSDRSSEAFDKAAKDGKSVQAIAKSGKKIKEGMNRLPANWKKHAQNVMSQTVQILVQQHGPKNQQVAKAALNYTAGGGEEENKIIQITTDPQGGQDPATGGSEPGPAAGAPQT
ncbi:MAG: hypothetical protein SFY67_00735 [Candidatus Melainabacteria bacterium]|nr:hypothetical protein [Candidatus Melainabacteria bacterium]